ncbi:hypothetical protein [Nocardiopsis synnemataformans]|uniref:hypothetical protein n=1 Tax=Nocardiopsis synnemataformans TaxID=61305 RepID=UPI003EBA4C07
MPSRDLDDSTTYARQQVLAHQRGLHAPWSRIAELSDGYGQCDDTGDHQRPL